MDPKATRAARALRVLASFGTSVTETVRTVSHPAIAGNGPAGALVHLVLEGDSRPVDIAKALFMTTGGATKVIDLLEERGLVERSSDSLVDGRGVLVSLTDEGRAVTGEFLAAIAVDLDSLIEALDAID